MKLEVKEIVIPQEISFNFEELKAELAEKVKTYEMMVYTDDQIKDAKADRANLNKLKKALNDERIRREREYMAPFEDFKKKVNEVIAIIDRPIAVIDRQVKEYEEMQRAEKKNEIMSYLSSIKLPYGIQPEQLFMQNWLNASVSMKSVREQIDIQVDGIKQDVATLEELDDYQAFAIACYKETLDLRDTLARIKYHKAQKAEQERIEKERQEVAQIKAEEPAAYPPADFMNPPEDPKPEKPAGQWIRFEALLTPELAKELKHFFLLRAIQYRPIA